MSQKCAAVTQSYLKLAQIVTLICAFRDSRFLINGRSSGQGRVIAVAGSVIAFADDVFVR